MTLIKIVRVTSPIQRSRPLIFNRDSAEPQGAASPRVPQQRRCSVKEIKLHLTFAATIDVCFRLVVGPKCICGRISTPNPAGGSSLPPPQEPLPNDLTKFVPVENELNPDLIWRGHSRPFSDPCCSTSQFTVPILGHPALENKSLLMHYASNNNVIHCKQAFIMLSILHHNTVARMYQKCHHMLNRGSSLV